MGKNNGGKKQKSMKNSNVISSVRLDDITPNAEYDHTFAAIVTKSLGSKRFEVSLINSNLILNSVLPGSFRKRVAVGDFVFIQYEEGLGGSNCFILHIYAPDEIIQLNIAKTIHNINDTNIGIVVDNNGDEQFIFEDI